MYAALLKDSTACPHKIRLDRRLSFLHLVSCLFLSPCRSENEIAGGAQYKKTASNQTNSSGQTTAHHDGEVPNHATANPEALKQVEPNQETTQPNTTHPEQPRPDEQGLSASVSGSSSQVSHKD